MTVREKCDEKLRGGVVLGSVECRSRKSAREVPCTQVSVQRTDAEPGAPGVVIALPELDNAFTDKQFVLAFLKDGKALDGKEGPYRIVIPDEKRMARWVRQVTALKIAEVD
jgi:hypothetical protein